MKLTCDVCKKSVKGTTHWLGDMSRFRPIKPDEYKWAGMRVIIICDDCFQKHINDKEADNDL